MTNGYELAMRAFTKLLKPSLALLQYEGYVSVIYADDCSLQGDLFTECTENVIRTTKILEGLGFYFKIDKSEMLPKQQITFLRLIIDTHHMTTKITIEKKQKKLIYKRLRRDEIKSLQHKKGNMSK